MKNLPLYDLSAIRQEKSRRRFFDFVRHTKPDFVEGWFNRVVSERLQKFYEDVKAGRQPRLMIFAPPRSGKSELFSRRFPAWALGKDPDLQIIATSYSSDLSSRMNRDVQRIIDDPLYEGVFPQTRLNSKNIVTVSGTSLRNSEIFEVVDHTGAYRSAGVGAGITGMGADIAIIDDPVKDAKEANSTTIRNGVWDWYTTTLYTRLSPKSGILLGMTRWHEDDLAGRLLEAMKSEEGDQWDIVRFPAIAEEDEKFRCAGEPLHPQRYPLDRLDKIRVAVGTYTWNALYQQRPSAIGGNIIKGEWFRRYKVLPKLQYRKIFVDTAQKTKERNDYSVFECWGKGDDGRVYLVDMIRGKWEAPELKRRAIDFWRKHKAQNSKLIGSLRSMEVEDKASGTGLIQEIWREALMPVKAIQRDKDKYTRVLDVVGFIESGYVYLPEDEAFVSDFVGECEAFTADDSHMHDDQIDPMCDAISDMLVRRAGLNISNKLLEQI